MRVGPTRTLLIGVALAAIVAVGGRYSTQYFDDQAETQSAKEKESDAEFKTCVKRYYAEHSDPVGEPKHRGMTFDEAVGLTDHAGNPIPCQQFRHFAAKTSAQDYKKYSARTEYWTPKAAIALGVLFAAPWLWQFLLRRVAELGAAFRGEARGN